MNFPYINFILGITYIVLFGMRIKPFESQIACLFDDPFSVVDDAGGASG